jgi:hypothetical protein
MFLAVGLPAAVSAQQGPPDGSMGSHGGMMIEHHLSDADRAKMIQLHNQARAAVLKALTPAHKALLGSVVSGLTLAANPDPRAAAAKLDAALSASEKKAILDAANSMREHMRAMMPSPSPGMGPHPMQSMRPMDPGELLLMMSAMSIMSHDGMMMHAGMP